MNVKTVSYRDPDAPKAFTKSLLETGFAVLTDHPIPKPLISDAFAEWETFFSLPQKHGFLYDTTTQAGYFPFRSENAKDSKQKDLKEFYHYYPARGILPPTARYATPEMYKRLTDLGAELLGWIEQNTPEEVRKKIPSKLPEMIERSEETLLRALHYPPLTGAEEEGAVRAAAHEDINLITLLPAATAPGLEVQDLNGKWHAVACDPGMIAINSGDMLKYTTQGYYPSTTHRVMNPKGPEAKKSRYSMPLFLHPRRDALLTPERTSGDFLDDRLREIGLLKGPRRR